MRQTMPLASRVVSSGPSSASSAGGRSAEKTSCRPSRSSVSMVCSNSTWVARLPIEELQIVEDQQAHAAILAAEAGQPAAAERFEEEMVNCSAER